MAVHIGNSLVTTQSSPNNPNYVSDAFWSNPCWSTFTKFQMLLDLVDGSFGWFEAGWTLWCSWCMLKIVWHWSICPHACEDKKRQVRNGVAELLKTSTMSFFNPLFEECFVYWDSRSSLWGVFGSLLSHALFFLNSWTGQGYY